MHDLSELVHFGFDVGKKLAPSEPLLAELSGEFKKTALKREPIFIFNVSVLHDKMSFIAVFGVSRLNLLLLVLAEHQDTRFYRTDAKKGTLERALACYEAPKMTEWQWFGLERAFFKSLEFS